MYILRHIFFILLLFWSGAAMSQVENETSEDKGKFTEVLASQFEFYRTQAEEGSAPAQSLLGYYYANGIGVPQSYSQAWLWYQKSADQGYGTAQYELGEMYYRGTGVKQDFVKAFSNYRLAAAQGHVQSQFQIGWMYYRGNGIPQDLIFAHMWMNISSIHPQNSYKSPEALDAIRSIMENVEKKMTREAVLEAQKYARNCLSSNYTNCG